MKIFQNSPYTIGLRAILITILTLQVFGVAAQTIDVGPPDTSICGGDPIDLIAITTSGGGGGITPTTPTLACDDCTSQIIDIGFAFEFFGNTYTQCVIASNGYISFDLTQANGGSPWAINQASPFPGVPDNAIMFPWQDIYPGNIGSGTPQAVNCGDGTFIVDFTDISMFSCTDLNFTMQAVLYEGTNVIETYLTEKPLCAAWNGGAAIHGLENIDGTQSVIVPGRNFPDQWAVLNDAVRFTPDGLGSYTIDQTIPFNPIPVGIETYEWTDDQGTILGTGTSLTVQPIEPTWYWCEYQSACAAITVTDSILVTIGNANMIADSINTTCVGFSDGGVFIDPTGSIYPATAEVLDAATATVQLSMTNVSGPLTLGGNLSSGIAAGSYIAQVTDAVGCITQVNFVVNDPPELTFTATAADATCFEYGDGYVIVNQDGNAIAPLIFVADSGAFAAQISVVDVLDTIHGLYANNYNITMMDANNCAGTPVDVIVDEPTDLVPNADHIDVLCFGEEMSMAWAEPTGSVGPYELLWNDQFAQTTDTALWLGAGTYSVSVIDAQNCFTDTTFNITQPDLLEVLISGESDTCGQFPSFLRADVSGGLPPYLYQWSHTINMDEIYIDTLNFFSMDSAVTYGDYSIVIVDSNFCQVTEEINIPLIPGPRAAFLTRSKPEEIIDPYALFDNESKLAVSYEWHFGDGYESYEENPEHEFRDTSGTFLVQLIATNAPQYGCSDTAWQYVDVTPYFTFYAPSAFTPDGDGMNDKFGPQGNHFDYETYRMTIYDRWGSEVFKTDNPEYWWDGSNRKTEKQVKDGVYVYLFEIKKFSTFEPKVISGTITVHRQHQLVD